MQWRRRIGLTILILAIISGLSYGFWPQSLLVDAAPAALKPLQVTIQEEGKTRLIDRYVIAAPILGYACRIKLEVGDTVKQGQELAVIEPQASEVLDPRRRAEAQARVAAAEAKLQSTQQAVAAAQAAADYAQAEFKRINALCNKSKCIISKDERDRSESRAHQAEANLRSSQFTVEVARNDLQAAKTALQHSASRGDEKKREAVVIRSSIDGQVLSIPRKSEGPIQSGQTLLEVGDPKALEVEVDLLSDDAVRVRPGTRVLFERWGGAPLEGTVRVVEPVGFTKVSALGVEEQRVLVIANITSPSELWSRLGDGYRLEASFIVWEGENVLQIPASALFRHGDGWAVFVIEGDKARRRAVEVGYRNRLSAEIRSGLVEGELVITHPDDSLVDSAAVQIRS